jgi:hypothetical protein
MHPILIAEAVSCRPPAEAARVQAQVRSCGICDGQSGTGTDFLRVLRFPLPVLIPPTAPHSVTLICSLIKQIALACVYTVRCTEKARLPFYADGVGRVKCVTQQGELDAVIREVRPREVGLRCPDRLQRRNCSDSVPPGRGCVGWPLAEIPTCLHCCASGFGDFEVFSDGNLPSLILESFTRTGTHIPGLIEI